ncbi:MAG: ABC transporter substrate-binding protein [Anaerolineaceae bacterium]|nr:ABC transporter substrate-binding protein [Anaerolineaceae bacterium]
MHSLSRREFVRLSSLTAAATVAAACSQPAAPTEPAPVSSGSTPAAPATAPSSGGGRHSEAPALAEQVAAGSLPPVEERLPQNPVVMPVVEEIGQYGGIWHRNAVSVSDVPAAGRLTNEGYLRWNADASAMINNLAVSYEVNEDASAYTFHLPAGMKWSDGEPFTADDVLYWYEDVLLNTDLTPTIGPNFRDPVNGEPMGVEKVDDQTVVFRFATPFGLFLEIVGGTGLDAPKHYMTQFHPTHTPIADLQPQIEAAGFTNWWELYGNKNTWQNPEKPVIWAWVPTRVPPEVPSVWERNPYYWKVDPEGNQLPYIDSLQIDIVENADLVNLRAVAGEIDMQLRHILWSNYPLFIENAEQGDYRVLQWPSAEGANTGLMLNQSHKDPVLRELFQTKDFRVALSIGINRDEIHQLAYQGFGEPRQAALIPQSPYYKDEYPTKWAEYDPETANELLDGIGLTATDDEGFRLRPDGEPLTINIEYSPVFGPWRDTVAMICAQWAEIGIRGVPTEEDRSLFTTRGAANEHDASIWTIDRCATPLGNPHWWHPHTGGYGWAEQYAIWYNTRGEQGEEPPEDIRRMFDLYDQMKGATLDQLPGLAEQYFDHWSDNLWVIGTVGNLPALVVVKNSFRNVPEEAVSDVRQNTPGNTAPEQYFWKQA